MRRVASLLECTGSACLRVPGVRFVPLSVWFSQFSSFCSYSGREGGARFGDHGPRRNRDQPPGGGEENWLCLFSAAFLWAHRTVSIEETSTNISCVLSLSPCVKFPTGSFSENSHLSLLRLTWPRASLGKTIGGNQTHLV